MNRCPICPLCHRLLTPEQRAEFETVRHCRTVEDVTRLGMLVAIAESDFLFNKRLDSVSL